MDKPVCGFVAAVGFREEECDIDRALDLIGHRGPDERGIYKGKAALIGHVRLKVIDLTGGSQPMRAADERYILVYNGEIYNFQELRRDLEKRGHRFYSRSDTEVLLHLYMEYGEGMLPRLNGIFAFAVWDAAKERLFVARDPYGVKPLFVWRQGNRVAVASEAKAFLAFKGFSPELNSASLHYYMNLRYVPGDLTLLKGVEKLSPSSWAYLSREGVEVHSYRPMASFPLEDVSRMSYGDHVENLRDLIQRAVRRQLVSDVPVGVSLSGGMDSGSLVAMMARCGADIEAFTVEFGEPTDETEDAKRVADHFGAKHHVIRMEMEPLRELPITVWHVEEPKVNAIQGYRLNEFVSRYVTVLLGGLGGDELFGGYLHYLYLRSGDRIRSFLRPRFLLSAIGTLSNGVSGSLAGRLPLQWDEYRRGLQMFLNAGRPELFYSILRNVWDHDSNMWSSIYGPRMLSKRKSLPTTSRLFAPFFSDDRSMLEGALLADFQVKMISDFLVNEDRTSMAHGVEARVPFLDRDLVEYVMAMPFSCRMPGGRLKGLMKEVMTPFLPKFMLEKRKWGFAVNPYYQFQKDLGNIAKAFLTKERVKRQGLFNFDYLKRILEAPPHPRMRWHYFLLWMVIGIGIWIEIFLEGKIPERDTTIYDYF